ncbi:holin family protein [Desulfosporosinus sp.]|uniref:phage holin family protein n=1 Tax=Desulfosporosinus sp. TaxID=157907 RepID=UPI0025B8E4C3|nr:phage holin family protein [Desulfosporosinus sp.]MBC2722045.1 phage holin family protein [Desulfosporosinus sp.]MBC2728028.1 phage holin family protein [Desulfosporosinus sp.]
MNIKEFSLNTVVAIGGTIVSAWLGGWDAALNVLVVLMILDYTTGFLGAIKLKNVNSEVMWWGGIRKGAILAVIAMAVLLDQMMGNPEPILRTMAIYFYVAREGVSVTENLGILGVPLPSALKRVLEQLQERSDKNG